MRTRDFTIIGMALAASLGAACRGTPGGRTISDRTRLQQFSRLPEVIPSKAGPPTEPMISLGRMLYFDTRLSRSQTISCNSCHPLDRYGADGQPTSAGYQGQRGERNSPTVYNAAAEFVQFWDGRSPSVEDQAKGPLLNPIEMAMPSAEAVVDVLTSMPDYVAAFRRAFPGERNPVTFDHAAQAVGAFERKLVTPSRWDQFLAGDEVVLSAEEKGGFNVFVEEGCSNCHTGLLVGGNAYQRLGVRRLYPDASDPGRYNVTKSEPDRMFFKIPSLRNVEMTGPYFHKGKVDTLHEAVVQMADYQLGKKISDRRVEAIVTWLKSLTGDIPLDYVKPPDLPKSTSRTPMPITTG